VALLLAPTWKQRGDVRLKVGNFPAKGNQSENTLYTLPGGFEKFPAGIYNFAKSY
jgi:hypothetical protein